MGAVKKEERTEERRNRFNGQSVMLTKKEADKHDAIFMHELMATIEEKKKLNEVLMPLIGVPQKLLDDHNLIYFSFSEDARLGEVANNR